STITRPDHSDELLAPACLVRPNGSRGLGAGSERSCARAGSERSCARVRAAAAARLRERPCRRPTAAPGVPLEPRKRVKIERGRRPASAGVPGPASCPPLADGMISQYWLYALTVAAEQGEP